MGAIISFASQSIWLSSGSMAALNAVWFRLMMGSLPPRKAEEEAVLGWFAERHQWAKEGYSGDAPILVGDVPPFDTLAGLEYLRRCIEITANDLLRGGTPDETLWNNEIGWSDDNRPRWTTRLSELLTAVDATLERATNNNELRQGRPILEARHREGSRRREEP